MEAKFAKERGDVTRRHSWWDRRQTLELDEWQAWSQIVWTAWVDWFPGQKRKHLEVSEREGAPGTDANLCYALSSSHGC